ncbi:isoprenylcysteine carboxylmethyltransferase family protein [Candidatus Woesearchaeota archaeon]|nr:isoprenylcysteine carboxylmethyltransferase family protein [Candidatus Woesearchaeota archaeon]
MKLRGNKFYLRFLLLIIVLLLIFNLKEILQHFHYYFTGGALLHNTIVKQNWRLVLLNIVFFIAFLIPLSFRRKTDWKEYGLVSAFFVSLFVEMYGIPLTIIFASKFLFKGNIIVPENIYPVFRLFGVTIAMTKGMVYGALIIILGIVLVSIGWITLYKNIKRKGFVKNGIYSFSRHPQYLGFILIVVGWFVGWPTILTLIFTPILCYKYIRLCKTEEKEMTSKFPEYTDYKEKVPFLV